MYNDSNEFQGKGTRSLTRGPCFGVHPETGERRWFPTRTRLKKAGFRYSQQAWGKTDIAAPEAETTEEKAA